MGRCRFDFGGETVLVTGASSGIGRVIALRFAESGATVVNADVRADPKDEDEETTPTHELAADADGDVVYVETDVSDRDSVRNAISVARDHGGVDVLVNNAALYALEPLLDADPETVERLFEVNVRGLYFTTQLVADEMVEQGDGGAVVNLASISSNLAQHDQSAYDATKGAVRMFTRNSALELAEHDVRVNAVAPGQITTVRPTADLPDDQLRPDDDLIKPVPLERVGRPTDVASAVLFLASDGANYVTGELLRVDGGWSSI